MNGQTIHPRKLARSMARAQLDKAKVTGYNKELIGPNGRKMPSMFSINWKDLSVQAAGLKKAKSKVRK